LFPTFCGTCSSEAALCSVEEIAESQTVETRRWHVEEICDYDGPNNENDTRSKNSLKGIEMD
jgi:hypothetical protein